MSTCPHISTHTYVPFALVYIHLCRLTHNTMAVVGSIPFSPLRVEQMALLQSLHVISSDWESNHQPSWCVDYVCASVYVQSYCSCLQIYTSCSVHLSTAAEFDKLQLTAADSSSKSPVTFKHPPVWFLQSTRLRTTAVHLSVLSYYSD